MKRRNILFNSNGKRNSILLSPKDRGYKIYCWKKDNNEISVIDIVIKKIRITKNNNGSKKIITKNSGESSKLSVFK